MKFLKIIAVDFLGFFYYYFIANFSTGLNEIPDAGICDEYKVQFFIVRDDHLYGIVINRSDCYTAKQIIILIIIIDSITTCGELRKTN